MKLKPLFLVSVVALMFAAGLARAEDDTERQQKILETRMKMAAAKFLVRNGKKEEAAAMVRALFPNGPSGGETALEYYHIVGSTSEGWDEARSGLEKLVKAEPYVMLYRRELAKHLITREATRRAGIRILATMARQPDADKQLTMEVWQGALALLGSGSGDAQMYREYLAVDPANMEIRERFVKAQQGSLKPKPAASKPSATVQHRGLTLLEEGNLEEAERVLAEAREKSLDDPEITGGLGLIRLRQGRHAEAKELFERALGLDADNRSKWESLAATATFWKLMGESSAARDAKNPDIAEDKVRAALRLEPDNAEGLALLGGILSDRGNLAEAEKHYRESLRLDPANGSAIRGLSGLLSGQGRRADILALLDSLGGEQAATKYAYIRAGVLRDEADIHSAAGRTAEAEALLKKALQLAPEMPWVRFDLARLYQKQGLPVQGRVLMKDGLEAAPGDPQMLYANALFLVGLDEADDALLLLDKISPAERTPSILSLRQKAEIQLLIRKAGALEKDGRRSEALALMERAGADAGDDPEFVSIVANAWMRRSEPLRATGLMRSLLKRQASPPVGLRLRFASLLNWAEQDEELVSLLGQLAEEKELSGEQRKELLRLQSSAGIRRADALRKGGNHVAAHKVLVTVLEQNPEDFYVRLALARVEREAGNVAAARWEIETVLTATHADDLDVRLNVASQLIDMNDMATARQIADQLMETTVGNNARVLILFGRIAKAGRRYDEAMGYFRQAKAAEAREAESRMNSPVNAALALMLKIDDEIYFAPIAAPVEKQLGDITRKEEGISLKIAERLGDVVAGPFAMAGQLVFPEQPLQTEAEEEIAYMERRREGRLTAGYDIRSKPGTAGVSAFTATELPIEVRIPLGYSGHAMVHVDPVSADAGTLLPNDIYTLNRYGQIQALAPAGIAGVLRQSARGVAVAVGYETDDWRADIGTTPLGFPVQDIVGGFKTYRSAEPFYYYADLSRRPVTSSLVSYAGARDPVSGEVWGGVRSNGGDLRVGFERGRFDAYVGLGYHLLTGKNVQTNTQLELRTGINRAFIKEEGMRLFAGFVLTHWRYRDDLSYYTFGHGGYYSPQTYYSLATPVSWDGRTGRWSYLLKGSVSASTSYVKDMPFYPARADLQALAGNPYHTGGSGHGMGYSLGGALEYQATPHLFIGGRIEIDRSEYYTPNFATFYLRYMFDPHTGPVPYPPTPVKPYSRF